jgi:quinol monooxygenase YgiN
VSVVVVATIVPKPEYRAEVIAIISERLVPGVHGEDGCELYALHEGADRLVMVEKWADQAALDAHSAGATLREVGPTLADKLAAPMDVQVLAPHPAGTAEQGAL